MWKLHKEGLPSIKEMAEMFVEKAGHKMFEVVNGKEARIIIRLPLDEKFLSAFSDDSFFEEDSLFIREAMKSLLVGYEQLRHTPAMEE